MTEQNQTEQSLDDIVQAKLDADERIINMIVDEVDEVFSDNQVQADFMKKLAIKLYHNSSDIDEINVQGMYISAVLDALSRILVEDKKIITPQELQDAVKEAHDISMASIEEANQIYASRVAAEQASSESTPVSEVMIL